MSPNFLWTPIKFSVSSFILNCSCPSSSQHHEYSKNRLLSLLQTRIHGPIDLSFPALDRWHWNVCHIIQMQYIRLFFSAELIHALEHGFVWCNNHKTTRPLSVSPCMDSKSALSLLSKVPLYLWSTPL